VNGPKSLLLPPKPLHRPPWALVSLQPGVAVMLVFPGFEEELRKIPLAKSSLKRWV